MSMSIFFDIIVTNNSGQGCYMYVDPNGMLKKIIYLNVFFDEVMSRLFHEILVITNEGPKKYWCNNGMFEDMSMLSLKPIRITNEGEEENWDNFRDYALSLLFLINQEKFLELKERVRENDLETYKIVIKVEEAYGK